MLLSEKSIYPSKRLDKPIEVTLDLVIESIDTFDDLNKLLDISVLKVCFFKENRRNFKYLRNLHRIPPVAYQNKTDLILPQFEWFEIIFEKKSVSRKV